MKGKIKLTRFVWISTVLVSTILFSAKVHCQAPKVNEKPIELKFASVSTPVNITMTKVAIPWAKELEKATNGRLKIVFYSSHSMGRTKDHYDFAVNGISDISFTLPVFTPGRFPLTSIIELPFMSPNSVVGTQVMFDLFQKFPEIVAEHSRVKVLWIQVTPPSQVHTVKKLIKTLDDFKGMTLGSGGGLQMKTITMLGAAPQNIPSQEAYQALQRKVIEGIMISYSSLVGNKLHEVARYHTRVNAWSFNIICVMNRKSYDSLPKDLQNIIDDVSRRTWLNAGKGIDEGDEESLEILRKTGVNTIYEMTEEENQKLRAAVKPLWDQYAGDLEAKGLPGRKIVDEAFRLTQKYGKGE